MPAHPANLATLEASNFRLRSARESRSLVLSPQFTDIVNINMNKDVVICVSIETKSPPPPPLSKRKGLARCNPKPSLNCLRRTLNPYLCIKVESSTEMKSNDWFLTVSRQQHYSTWWSSAQDQRLTSGKFTSCQFLPNPDRECK